ncbi:MAG: helix-turn-helix transcriptional regulator [Actinobacteria bacterium]|nr:helix-turn-helix transcriptional regulator [Actinomycetota bacterium]
MPIRTYQEVIGRNLRWHRKSKNLRQDELAERARAFGMSWSQATVAAIETGRRAVSAEEEKLLLSLLEVSLAQLLGGSEKVNVAGVIVEASVIHSWTSGSPAHLQERSSPAEGPVTEEWRRRIRPVAKTYSLKDDDDTLSYLAQTALASAEVKAARSLGVWSSKRGALEVAAASLSLWGHSLTEERNERWRAKALTREGRQLDPEGRQKAMGWITRELQEELREHIRAAKRRKR